MYGMPKLMDPQRMDRPSLIVVKLGRCPSLWFEFDEKWGNHTAKECYNHIRFMRNQ